MKQKLSALLLGVVSFMLFSFSQKKRNEYPGEKVIKNFKIDFPNADNVVWKLKNTAYVASFTNNQKTQLAYYNENGDFLGQAWLVKLQELPLPVINAILKDADASAVKNLHIFLRPDNSLKYYASIEVNGKKVTKEILPTGEAFVVRKTRISVG